MPGKLKNRTRVAKTYNLSTKVAPVRHLFARREEGKDGTVRASSRRLILPASITILAGKLSESLPDSVVGCPEVAKAIAKRDLLWVEDDASTKTAEPSSAPAAGSSVPDVAAAHEEREAADELPASATARGSAAGGARARTR